MDGTLVIITLTLLRLVLPFGLLLVIGTLLEKHASVPVL